MKHALLALSLLGMPSLLMASETGGQEFSFLSSFLQMIAALALVVGLIVVTWHFSGKMLRGFAVGQHMLPRHIRLVETRYLGPKKSLLLVEVGGEYLLLSSSEAGLTLIKQIDMLEEIEVVEEKTTSTPFQAILTRMRQS